MTEIDLVKKFYEHLASGDRIAAYSLLAADFVLKQADSLRYGGEYVGVNGLNNFFVKFSAFWKEFKTLHTDYNFSENKVFAFSKIMGIIFKTEQKIETEMVQVYVVNNNKLVSAQPFYFDTKLICEA